MSAANRVKVEMNWTLSSVLNADASLHTVQKLESVTERAITSRPKETQAGIALYSLHGKTELLDAGMATGGAVAEYGWTCVER